MFTPLFFVALVLVAVESYLLGSVNCAIIVSRVYAKDDVRLHGSGSAGMTNILRTYGKGPAVITAAGDFLKAVIGVCIGRLVFTLFGFSDSFPLDSGYIAGLFVLLGHLYPVFFRFKGGKGVMTTLGVIFMTNPIVFVIIAAIFVPLIFITRIVSIGSIFGAVCYPVLTWLVLHMRSMDPRYDTICATAIALIIIYMHRQNIKRLLSGTENKFGKKKNKPDDEG